jgi:hypothetical protein
MAWRHASGRVASAGRLRYSRPSDGASLHAHGRRGVGSRGVMRKGPSVLTSQWRAAIRSAPRAVLFLAGLGALLWISLLASGGKEHLVEYSAHMAHKMTARAMMGGALSMDRTLASVTLNDEQVYNGAGYTNWGFGVPLLQIPFDALVGAFRGVFKGRYFPDRLVFFLYLTALVPLLWTAIHRSTFARRIPGPAPLGAWAFSWCATLAALTYVVYPLMCFRFIVYEETIAYFVLAQLFATALYVRFVEKRGAGWLCGVAVAAALGLLIRPTGLPYLVMWGALVVVLDRRWRTGPIFAAAASPLLVFWLYSNWVKGGSPLTFGLQNALPDYPFHYAMIRFGSRCAAADGYFAPAKWLLKALFLKLSDPTPEMSACHFVLESRATGNEPFFPPAVPLVLLGSLLHYVSRRERRPDLYLPHLAFLALLGAYAYAGAGFSYRYVGDFWPLVVLVLVQVASTVHLHRSGAGRSVLALAFVLSSWALIAQDIEPTSKSIMSLDEEQMASADETLLELAARPLPPLPPRRACGELPVPMPRANGIGWGRQCQVDIATNLYLGVEKKAPTYKLRFRTDVPPEPSLRVYVNGKYFTARLESGQYVADCKLDYDKLASPAVMVTIEWTRGLVAPPAKLLEIELTPG